MSLKQEIESWVEALAYYDGQDYEKALEIFEQNADTSKIYFNIGMIHATLGEHEKAVEAYQRATKLDSFLAVAYFQMGVSNFLLGEFTEAMANFNEALLYLRGNTLIDYEQLGLKFKLFSCEVLFNRGLCYIYDQQMELGMKDLEYAAKEKQVEDHAVIDEAIQEQAEGYTVFSVGVGVLYRPNESKVRNVKAKDYLGKARLVAASDAQNAFTGFAGAEVRKQVMTDSTKDDRAPAETSFAATNLVKPELRKLGAEETPTVLKDSAPARSLKGERPSFPPTPPPDNDLTPVKPTRANTVASGSMAGRPVMGRPNEPSRVGRDMPRERARLEDGYQMQGNMEPRRAYSARTSSSTAVPSQRSNLGREGQQSTRRRANDRISEYSDEIESNPYNDDLYDYYNGDRHDGSRRRDGSSRRRPAHSDRFPEDDEDYASDAYEGSSLDEDEFEIVGSRGRSGSSRRPEVRKIKIKAHGEDTRMILIATSIGYSELVSRVRDKFAFPSQHRIKIKIRDEDGDGMISLSDQEDLEMAIASSKAAARRERVDQGKMEIWIQAA